ncbi:MAG: TIGR01440 family protein [Ruminococcus sp.]|nr:TIGR01440 family protein [Ruminococcus sp.]
MFDKIKNDANTVFAELIETAKLRNGSILVIGCSTSEITGDTIGTHSSMDTAKALYEGFYDMLKDKGIYIAVQCCEHLNRALVIERELADKLNLDVVNAVPQPKAGGSSATIAYSLMDEPVLVEHIRADAGVDIGGTLIGMHLKETAVPLRLNNRYIGKAYVSSARTRAKFIGGMRAVYNEDLM